jgi:RNA polymerase sigma-70 factor (family 1)
MASLSQFSEDELLSLLREDNRAAFEEIYRRHWPALMDAAWKRLQDTQTAEELVQDVFISLYLRRLDLVIHTSLAGYLKSALKYKVLNEVRARLVRDQYSLKVIRSSANLADNPHEQLDARELEQIINDKVNELPEKCREVFILSRQEHLSHQHIADRLGISVSTVEKHIGKALRIVRTHINEVQFITVIFIAQHLK